MTHRSTKSTIAGGNPFVVVPVVDVVVVEAGAAGNLGGGSLTIRCRSSSMDIWVEPCPPPSSDTPSFRLGVVAPPPPPPPLGRVGESVPRKSSSSSSSSSSSANGKRPNAISMMVIPKDHTSDFTLYWSPWIRSGCASWGDRPRAKSADVQVAVLCVLAADGDSHSCRYSCLRMYLQCC